MKTRERRPLRRKSARPFRHFRLESLEDRAVPTTLTWTGAVDALWATVGNWSGGTGSEVPDSPDDILVFGPGAANLDNTNDLPNFELVEIQITAPGYTLGGNSVSLSTGLSDTADSGTNMVSLAINGVGGVTKSGTGTLVLDAANGFTGTVSTSDGVLAVTNANSLGATSSGTTLASSSAILELWGGVTLAAEPINYTSTGQIIGRGGDNTITGTIALPGANAIIAAEPDSTLTVTGVISGASTQNYMVGASGLTGTVVFSAANTFNNFLSIRNGTLIADHDQALGGTTNWTQVLNGATLAFRNGVTINEPLLSSGSGVGGGGALRNLTGNNTVTGSVTLSTAPTFGVDAGTLTISGTISGGTSLTKTGPGVLALSEINTYTGATTVNAGTLLVTGSIASSSGVTVTGTGVLAGTGTVGGVTATSGGVVTPGLSPGILTAAGNVGFQSGSTFGVELDGTTVGTEYDQLDVTGAVSLGGATLDVSLGFIPSLNDSFTVINNDGADPVTGTFNGLGEGGTFLEGIYEFTISYVGGDGNDVVLTLSDIIYTWDGGGADSNWTTAANWVDDLVPAEGGSLLFPDSAARLSNTNDFAAGTDFRTIIIAGPGYAIVGNAIDLTRGIAATFTSNTSTLALDFVFQTDVWVDVADGGALDFQGSFGETAGPHGLTKVGAGSMSLTEAQTYTGTTTVSGGTLLLHSGATFAGPGAVVVNAGGTLALSSSATIGSLAGGGNVDLSSNSLATGSAGTDTTFSGVIGGTGSLVKQGAGTFTLSGANLHAGGTQVSGGTLSVGSGSHLGTGTVTLLAGTTLEVSAAATVDNAITLNGDATIDNAAGGSTLVTLAGLLSGSSELTKSGSLVRLTNTGNEAAFSGGITVSGSLSIMFDDALPAGTVTLNPSAVLTIFGAGTTIDNPITMLGAALIDNSPDVTLTGLLTGSSELTKLFYGVLTLTNPGNSAAYTGGITLYGGAVSVASDDALVGGPVTLSGNGAALAITDNATIDNDVVLNVAAPYVSVAPGATAILSGVISETGGVRGLTKSGPGTLVLTGTSTYTGLTEVDAGTLRVEGTLGGNSGVTVDSGATLGGTGSVPAILVLSGGAVAPGSSPGVLNSGDVEFTAGSTFSVELDGTTVGTEYDQLDVTGTVSLGGATLDVSLGFVPSVGDMFTVINNDGADAVSGAFDGLPEGTEFLAGGSVFRITYAGGDGNDVVLTAIETPTVAVISSAPSSSFGEGVTFSVIVSGSGVAPTGNVTLFIDGELVETVALSSGEAAFAEVCDLSVGSHVVDVTYDGDFQYSTSLNTLAGGQVVDQASTTTVVTAAPNPSVFGEAVTFTAVVSSDHPCAGTPTGNAELHVDGALVETVALVDGVATFAPISDLVVGGHAVTVDYLGDENFTASSSETLDQAVGQAASSVGLAASASDTTYGQPVTLTATVLAVAPGAGTPTGTVSFFDGEALIGTAPVVNGTAELSRSDFAAGDHLFTAAYSGDENFTASSSETLDQAVGQAASSVGLAASASDTTYGQPVTLTATVLAVAPGAGTPTGTVSFFDGEALIGTAPVVNGTAELSRSDFAAGDHLFTAAYSGDENFAASSSETLDQAVGQAASSVGLAASASDTTYGQPVTLTATVLAVAPGAGTPTGTVSFFDGEALIGTAPVVNGTAELSRSDFAAGDHLFTAAYSGDENFTASSSSATAVTVAMAASGTSIQSSDSVSSFGESVTFTAVVTGQASNGTVQFLDGTTVIGTVPLSGGIATFSTSSLGAGGHQITANFLGTDNVLGSSGSLIQEVTKGATQSTLSVSPAVPVLGAPTTITADVATPFGPGVSEGVVYFYDGADWIGEAAVVNGRATLVTTFSTTGTHSLLVSYRGGANYEGSNSDRVPVNVARAETQSTLESTLVGPIGRATGVWLGANVVTVTPAGGVPTGNVTFFANDRPFRTQALVGGSTSLYVPARNAVNRSFSFRYEGDANASPSTSQSLYFDRAYFWGGRPSSAMAFRSRPFGN